MVFVNPQTGRRNRQCDRWVHEHMTEPDTRNDAKTREPRRKTPLLVGILVTVCLLPILLIFGGIASCCVLQRHYRDKVSLLPAVQQIQPLMKYGSVVALFDTNRLEAFKTEDCSSPRYSGVVVLHTNITISSMLYCRARPEGGFFETDYPDEVQVYFNDNKDVVGVYFKPYLNYYTPSWGVQVDVLCDSRRLLPSHNK